VGNPQQVITFRPTPGKQEEFVSAREDKILFGGARGPGKSFGLAWKGALTPWEYHWEYHGKKLDVKAYKNSSGHVKNRATFVADKVSVDYNDFRAILVRRTYPQLERNLKPECDKIYLPLGAKWQERHHKYIFPSGAEIYLVHCKDRKAVDNYIGGNYHYGGIDEANMFPKEWVDDIDSSVRAPHKIIKAQFCLTANPGNIGHTWLKKEFVDNCKPIPDGPKLYNAKFDLYYQPMKSGKAFKNKEGLVCKFIPGVVFDNPFLIENDPKYVLKLKSLPAAKRAMWLDGNWDEFSGQYFSNWNLIYHTIDQKDFEYGKHFSNKTHKLFRFYDFGTKAPFVCLFAALDRDGYMTIFDEIVETDMPASKQAQYVNEYTEEKYGLEPADFEEEVADPAYWTRSGEKEGELYSPADHYEDQGIYLVPGAHDRAAMAKIVFDALEIPGLEEGDPPESARPRVRFTDNCEYCIESIPNLCSDDNDPEKVNTKGDDHAYDALGYGCMRILDYYIEKDHRRKEKSWRDKLGEINSPGGAGWKVA